MPDNFSITNMNGLTNEPSARFSYTDCNGQTENHDNHYSYLHQNGSEKESKSYSMMGGIL